MQSLILAGTNTTTSTLTWALSLVFNNREVLHKAIHELDTQIVRERKAMESDLKKLEYYQGNNAFVSARTTQPTS